MKKSDVLIIISLLFISFLFITLAHAQETPGLPAGLGEQTPEEMFEQMKNQTFSKWDDIGREWKVMLLQNKVFAALNSFFTKYSVVFSVLFKLPYSLSITLFFVVILWIFFAFQSGRVIQKLFEINDFLAFLLGICIAVILAQINLLIGIVKLAGWFFFVEKAWWWYIISGIIILVAGFIIGWFFELGNKLLEERLKRLKEAATAVSQEQIQKFTGKLFKKS